MTAIYTPDTIEELATSGAAGEVWHADGEGGGYWETVDVSAAVTAGIAAHVAAADPHAQYVLSAGRAGGQTIRGGTGAGENLTLESTSHETKGSVFLGGSSGPFVDNTGLVRTGGIRSRSTAENLTLSVNNQNIDDIRISVSTGSVQFIRGSRVAGAGFSNSTAIVGLGGNLDLSGQAITSGGSSAGGVQIRGGNNQSAAGNQAGQVRIAAGVNTLNAASSGDIYFETQDTERLRISRNGKISQKNINGYDGSGTNVAGENLPIAGGRGTGFATGGSVVIQTAPPGGSGSALNALVDRMTVRDDGLVILHSLPTSNPSVTGALWNDSGTLKVSAG